MYHTVPNRFIKNSLTMLAIGNLNWFEREFCLAEREEAERRGVSIYEIIDEEVASVPVGAGGVVYLPFLQGERAPFVKQEARGVFFGLGDWHKRAHLLRAIFEGIALSTRDSYECMQKGEPLETTYLTGGGSRSPALRQILADCTGNIMKIPAGVELGAKGAAINAGVAVGIFKDHAEAVSCMVKIEREYVPDKGNAEKYAQLYEFYKGLIKAVWSSWERSWKLGIADW
jgi:sugar (pentulose or hexulose) kinase